MNRVFYIAIIDDNKSYGFATAEYLDYEFKPEKRFFIFDTCEKFSDVFLKETNEANVLDIVICDYKLDKDCEIANGFECANRISARYPDAKIIILTGEGNLELEHQSIASQYFYIQKGISAAENLSALLSNFIN